MARRAQRLKVLDGLRPPELWSEIRTREPSPSLGHDGQPRRAFVAALAFVVAAAGIGLAVYTFGETEPLGTSDVGTSSQNGSIAYVSGGTLWLVRPDGSFETEVSIDVTGFVGNPSWSPDGRRMVFDVNSYPDEGAPKGGYYDVYAADADGSNVVRLTRARDARLPAWSPDGARIAYTRQGPDGDSQIYVMNADGSGSMPLTSGPAFSVRPAWSPDGERIVFESVVDANSDIYVMAADGSALTRLTDDPAWEGNPVWSPQGDLIAFASDRSPSGIYVMNPDGTDARLLVTDDHANVGLSWSPDGSLLAFSSSRGPGFDRALYVLDVETTAITQITHRGGLWGPSWQPVTASVPTIEPAPELPATADVVETFEVGPDVRSVAYGDGSLWVATSNNDGTFGGRIVRIDPNTHDVHAEIPVDVIPTWEVGGGAMVFEGGDLWVAGDLEAPGAFDDPGGGADAAVIRIDASTNEVVQTITVGGAGGADLTFLNGELWVLLFGDETVEHAMEVARVDLQTGDVFARYSLDANWAHTIVAAEGRLVVLEGGRQAVNVGGHVATIDPTTNAVARIEIPSETFTPMPVLSRGQVWISTDPGFVRFDPLRESFPEPPVTPPPRLGGGGSFLEADDRGIWFLGPDLPGGRPGVQLNLFDPATGEATALSTLDEGSPVAMAVAPDSVWILNYEGTLTHVALG